MSNEDKALMDLIDAYAEARHISGCHTYNAKTAEARAKVVASLAASAGSEPVAWRYVPSEAWREYVITQDLRVAEDARGFGLAVTPLYTHPSPPEGMVGVWRQGVEAVAAMLTKKADDFAQEHGHDDMGGLSFGRGAKADAKLDYHSGLLELADEVREMRANAPPECRSDNPVLMEHSGCGRGAQVDTLTVRLNPGDKVILCPGPVTRASIAAPPIAAGGGNEASHG